jgi:hypothetical protein
MTFLREDVPADALLAHILGAHVPRSTGRYASALGARVDRAVAVDALAMRLSTAQSLSRNVLANVKAIASGGVLLGERKFVQLGDAAARAWLDRVVATDGAMTAWWAGVDELRLSASGARVERTSTLLSDVLEQLRGHAGAGAGARGGGAADGGGGAAEAAGSADGGGGAAAAAPAPAPAVEQMEDAPALVPPPPARAAGAAGAAAPAPAVGGVPRGGGKARGRGRADSARDAVAKSAEQHAQRARPRGRPRKTAGVGRGKRSETANDEESGSYVDDHDDNDDDARAAAEAAWVAAHNDAQQRGVLHHSWAAPANARRQRNNVDYNTMNEGQDMDEDDGDE